MPKADDYQPSGIHIVAQGRLASERLYTLEEISTLVAMYVQQVAEPNSMVDWRMSDFILWLKRQGLTELKKREREVGDGN